MTDCAFKDLTGIVLDKKPSEDFIYKFGVNDLIRITNALALQWYDKMPDKGVSTAFFGIDYLDYSLAADLKDNYQIMLSFKRQNGIYVPNDTSCGSCATGVDDKAAMQDILGQCSLYAPEDRFKKYFMLTYFDKGCCPFDHKINVRLEFIEGILS